MRGAWLGLERWVGVSTHTDEQVRLAEASCADYVAVGPVFATGTKLDAEPVIGLEGVRRARALTTKPIVAIGGITRANARSVIEAGADSVAVISGCLLRVSPSKRWRETFLAFWGRTDEAQFATGLPDGTSGQQIPPLRYGMEMQE